MYSLVVLYLYLRYMYSLATDSTTDARARRSVRRRGAATYTRSERGARSAAGRPATATTDTIRTRGLLIATALASSTKKPLVRVIA